MISPIYSKAKKTPFEIRADEIIKELHETWDYTIEEQNHIRELLMTLPKTMVQLNND